MKYKFPKRHRDRCKAARAEAERLLGRKLRSDTTVSIKPGSDLVSVRQANRPAKVWCRAVTSNETGKLLGYRAGMNYRNWIEIYHHPENPDDWNDHVLIHELGHSILGGTEAEDHAAMKRAGFAF